MAKKKDTNNLVDMSDKDLAKALAEHQSNLQKDRFALSGARFSELANYRTSRRMIARIKTEMNRRVQTQSTQA